MCYTVDPSQLQEWSHYHQKSFGYGDGKLDHLLPTAAFKDLEAWYGDLRDWSAKKPQAHLGRVSWIYTASYMYARQTMRFSRTHFIFSFFQCRIISCKLVLQSPQVARLSRRKFRLLPPLYMSCSCSPMYFIRISTAGRGWNYIQSIYHIYSPSGEITWRSSCINRLPLLQQSAIKQQEDRAFMFTCILWN